MLTVDLNVLSEWLERSLTQVGMRTNYAHEVADVVVRSTLKGVGHHDIEDFPTHFESILSGRVKINPDFTKLKGEGCIEVWDGDNGLGELTCSFSMERAVALAEEFGLGLCTIRNSNHFLAASPYVERASEKGLIALILGKGAPTMGVPGHKNGIIGALPMGYAIPTGSDFPILFDACLAYASMGTLRKMENEKQSVPSYWGYDEEGKPTEDPGKMSRGTRLAIGGYKGFSLALLGEVLTSLLSDGCIIDEKKIEITTPSHTAIVINPSFFLDEGYFRARMDELIERISLREKGVHIPGEGAYSKKQAIILKNTVNISQKFVDKMDVLYETYKLDIDRLPVSE